jgi:hypothetical protein
MEAVTCLTEQQAQFAANRWPQLSVTFRPIAELAQEGWQNSLLVSGNVLAEAEAGELIRRTYGNAAPMLILPPLPPGEIADLLGAPAPVNIINQVADKVMIEDATLKSTLHQDELRIYCTQAIATPLQPGVLATAQRKPVIWAFQPTRQATPVVWVTVQLLLISARSDPVQQQQLFSCLLTWARERSRTTAPDRAASGSGPSAVTPVPFKLLRAVVIALAVRPDLETKNLSGWLASRLVVEISNEQREAALRWLQQEGIADDKQRPLPVPLANLVDKWQLHAWLREARKLEDSYE